MIPQSRLRDHAFSAATSAPWALPPGVKRPVPEKPQFEP
jgi:hypothetical protein